mgnify:CR=1 FL=1
MFPVINTVQPLLSTTFKYLKIQYLLFQNCKYPLVSIHKIYNKSTTFMTHTKNNFTNITTLPFQDMYSKS